VLTLFVAGTLSACSLASRHADPANQPAFVDGLPSSPPSVAPSSAAPTTEPTPSRTKRSTASAVPTPPAPPPPPPPPSCAGFSGKNLSKTAVKNLVVAASTREPWAGVQQPSGLTKPLPKITVPVKLLKAIAAQESGWQSACKSNDGLGFGLFQVSAETESFINNRFGEHYDRFTPADNVAIATDNLAWLLVYFGQFHFDENYSWTNTKLVDAVIASFNVGYGTVDQGDAIVIGPSARTYVNAVRQQELPTADCQTWG